MVIRAIQDRFSCFQLFSGAPPLDPHRLLRERHRMLRSVLVASAGVVLLAGSSLSAQAPNPSPGVLRAGAARATTTSEQTTAVARMNAALSPQLQRLAAARTNLVAAALAQPRDEAAVQAALRAI